jgi:hypothetical protein
MGTSYNPKIATDGLVFYSDPANLKSYPPNQDPYVNQTVLMLNGENIIDYSLNQTAITNNGAVTVSSTQYKVGQSSLSFSGASNTSYLHATTTSAIVFGTGDFTIEFWIYFNSVKNTNLVDGRDTTGNQLAISLYFVAYLRYFTNGADRITGPVLSTGVWYHIALSRVSSNTRMFVNGSQVGSTYADTNNYVGPNFCIGGFRVVPTANLNGYIDEFRVTKAGRYSSNFTPQTTPFYLPNTLIDLTKNKAVGTLVNSPTYSSANGGSIAFDGTNDYVKFPFNSNYNFGSGDFTVSAWINMTVLPSNNWASFVTHGVSGSTQRWVFYYDTRTSQSSPGLRFTSLNASNAVNIDISVGSTSGWSAGVWYYVTITRVGNVFTLYRNGVQVGNTVTDTDAIIDVTSNGLYLGMENTGVDAPLNGKISLVQIYKAKGLTSTEVFQNYNAIKSRYGY